MHRRGDLVPTAVDQYLVELNNLTGMSPKDWQDFLSCTKEEQAVIAQGYRDMDWRANPDTFGKVMAILNVITTFAGAVSGVAGAATAVEALAKL